jgi:arginine deiminase
MRIQVDSEIGPLERVMVHRPGREIDRMTPSMMDELLFDDILDGDQARREHDGFTAVLERAGAEVLDAQDLLAAALETEAARHDLAEELREEYGLPAELVASVASFEEQKAADLAALLVEGLRARPEEKPSRRRRFREPRLFDLPPVPNYFFQRDPQIVLGSRVAVASMATDARERERLLARLIFEHHPQLSGAYDALVEIDAPREGGSQWARHYPYATLEGGDVLVASPEIVLIGMSERTNRRGVEEMAEVLRREETRFRHLILVELPSKRSYMHLDTVFTFIDRGLCLAYPPVVEPGSPESAHVYHVDLTSRELAFGLRRSLRKALGEVGMEIELVPCGGPGELIDQQREQWTDGANAFAVAPGVIVLYRRNRRTLEELDRRGWRVLTEEQVLDGGEELLGRGPTVVTLQGYELSRARGGPRCMTMPLARGSVEE